MPTSLPSGEVTLLFTDVQGSTRLWEEHGSVFGRALELHNVTIQSCIEKHGGTVVKTVGDAFMVVFTSAAQAVLCAADIHDALAHVSDPSGEWERIGGITVRMGVHTGRPTLRDGDYFGPMVNRASRVCDAGHGGLALISEATRLAAVDELDKQVVLLDLGLHKLKDLGQEERLYLIRRPNDPSLPDRPLRTLSATPHNFPAQITSFMGRRKETAELEALLKKQASRLITITGPGGTGKTRLSMQIAADRLQDFPGGIWLVELASVTDPAGIAPQIALSLQIEMSASKDALTQVTERLRSKRALIVLDNFEQVAEGAFVVAQLLRDCPELVCIVTSRELLRVSGELEYSLTPLASPLDTASLSELQSCESVEMFVDRCRLSKPDFELSKDNARYVAGICRRLDGIPLAIELAAARMRALSPQAMAQRLAVSFDVLSGTQRDIPERQRTLRSTIDWSYDLLTEDERELFAELSVFDSGFDLEAAEAICTVPNAFDLVLSLRDKSLLKADEHDGEMRFSMLSTLRSYARERLDSSETGANVHLEHSKYYLALAEEWSRKLDGARSDVARAMALFTREIANMRSAMDWCIACSDTSGTMSWGRALARFLLARNLLEECENRLLSAQDAAEMAGDQRTVALLSIQRGRAAFHQGRLDAAFQRYSAAMEISANLGDRHRIPPPLINLGTVEWARGNLAKAKELWEQGLEVAKETNQPTYIARLLDDLGLLSAQIGDYEASEGYFSDALQMAKSNNDEVGHAFVLLNSAEAMRRKGDLTECDHRLHQADKRFRALGNRMGIAMCAIKRAKHLAEEEKWGPAELAVTEGHRIAEEDGDARWCMYADLVRAMISVGQHESELAKELLLRSLDVAEEVGDRRHMAEIALVLADLMENENRIADSLALVKFAEVEFETVCPPDSIEAAERYRLLEQKIGNTQPPMSESMPSVQTLRSILRPVIENALT